MIKTTMKRILIKAGLTVSALLLGSGVAFGQAVNLTAGPATAALPDGSPIPMWGYSCQGATGTGVSCAALNPAANTTTANTSSTSMWSPVVITVPYVAGGTSLTINLTNNLSFTNGNTVPTSLTIVGQVGGGLGSSPTRAASPSHAQLGVSWSTVQPAGTGATPSSTNPPAFTPPPQPPRVQSFGTEVASCATPPCAAVSLVWNNLRPGTYLIESGTHPSIQGPMGLYGVLVVTTPPTATTATPITETAAGTAYPNVSYDAELPLLLSEIDPVQNTAVSTAVNTANFKETNVWSGQPGGCGNPSSSTYNTCYPPAVNYTPLYYLINGVGFSRASMGASTFPITPSNLAPASGTGSVLVRLVNAGLRMHVPSIVGSVTNGANVTGAGTPVVTSGFTLIAEDGNPLPPTQPRVQTEIFMAAGKTFDVMINGPASGSALPALPIYDRQLSLSGNAVERDAGMLAYISMNGAAAPAASNAGAAQANADTYNSLISGQALTVSDPAHGVIANDRNVYGVALNSAVAVTGGTVVLNTNGTFTFTPASSSTSGSFGYCANGTTTICTTVTLGACGTDSSCKTSSSVAVVNFSDTARTASYYTLKPPGILAGATDSNGYALTVANPASITATGMTLVVDANGAVTATAAAPGTYSFTFQAQNSQGQLSNSGTATITFPAGSGLTVNVIDGYDHKTPIGDYRWVIEEDRTFYVDPNCTANPPPPGCATAGAGIVPTFGVNFHTSYMPFVAQGCTGPLSCESGQTLLGTAAVCDVGNGACRTTGSQLTQVAPGQVPLDPTKRYYLSVLPGDAANPFAAGYTGIPCGQPGANPATCSVGHGMGGAPIAAGQK
ncbi:MAG: hypothetical protein JO042_06860, partial [Sinobacteraceae bacterium]|nr:hypothetical protein [Nevskiaceae bacterium]